jgi:hypothetical protein
MSLDTTNNKSICPYPWTHSYVGSLYDRRLCCIGANIPELEKTSVVEMWNSEKYKTVRLKMLAGEKIDDCKQCYYAESVGLESLRMRINTVSTEEDLRAVTNPDGSVTTPGPTYFDHRTIHCNLQCISCGTNASSAHIKLFKDMWKIDKSNQTDFLYENSLGDEIIESILKKECNQIYWAGGEPMSSHVHWKVVEKMYELGQQEEYAEYIKGIHVHYNTNMTRLMWKGKKIPDLLELYQPKIGASIDGIEETFEYCRDGGKWSEVAVNWNEYYAKLNQKNQFTVQAVLSAPVIMDIGRWIDFFQPFNPLIENHRYIVDTSAYATHPPGFLDIRLYPKHIGDRIIREAIDRFNKSTLDGKANSILILESYISERNEKADFFGDPDLAKRAKGRTLYRDKFLKTQRSFGELLQIIDKEAYDWYMSL